MTSDDRDRKLDELLAKQEIREVILRFCRGIDRRDVELIESAFHPDATDNHGPFQGRAADFSAWAMGVLEKQVLTMHLVANQLIELDGDIAWSESYLLALHRTKRGDETHDWFLGARYVDRFERRGDVWKIAHRTTVHDWDRFDPLDGIWEPASEFVQGVHSRDDVAYRRES
jgi:ketosteroid isomerase-like protein